MNSSIKILTFFSIYLFTSFDSKQISTLEEKQEYASIIEKYLQLKEVEPGVVLNNVDRKKFGLLDYKFSWKKLAKGLEITIDDHIINTSKALTLNPVLGNGADSVNFANAINQLKIYQIDSVIGFVLSREPCSGLGCSAFY